ncbi:MAG: hemolysin [Halothiobacillaceae bacterium]|nr:MAG: hemolysin [Halothiobacillaceae bacterium]
MKHALFISLTAVATLSLNISGCAPAIVAGGAASVAADTRTAGTVVEDQSIEFRIAANLQKDPEFLEKTNINITSYNTVVLLTGEAKTVALRDRAEKIAKTDPKAKKIYNEIVVREPLPMKARNYDSWLTTKVKAKLVATEDVSSFNVKVVTSDTTVYLMGLISKADAQKVAQVAAHVTGVTRVVKAFEYVN